MYSDASAGRIRRFVWGGRPTYASQMEMYRARLNNPARPYTELGTSRQVIVWWVGRGTRRTLFGFDVGRHGTVIGTVAGFFMKKLTNS